MAEAAPTPADEAAFYRRRYFGPVLLLLQSLRFATTWLWFVLLVPYSMDISFPEGAVVARAWDAARGSPVYQDWREWPHQFAPYGPLTYYPVGWAARAAFGPGLHPHVVYRAGRIQSILAIAGICASLFVFARRLGVSPLWGFLAATAFLNFEPLLTFAASYRPDAPMACFALLALAIASGGEPTARRAALAFLSLSAAMWFKTTSWGAFLALAWWVWRTRGWRAGILAAAAFGGANLGIAALLNWATGGNLFLNMVGSLDNGWDPWNLAWFYYSAPRIPLAILLAGVILAGAALKRGSLDARVRVLAVALFASFGIASLQNMKVGADVNYYIEPYALASVFAVGAIARLWRAEARLPAGLREAALYLLVIPIAFGESYYGLKTVRYDLAKISKDGWKTPPQAEAAREYPGPLLVANPFLALERPAPATIMDLIQYQILVDRGQLDPEPLFSRLRSGEFDAVILSKDDLMPNGLLWSSRRVERAIHMSYVRESVVADLAFMKPRRQAPPGGAP